MPKAYSKINIYDQIASNKRKTWIFLILFVLFIVLVGYVFGMAMSDDALGPMGVFGVIAIFFGIMGYFFSGNMVMAVSRAKQIKKEDNPELFRVVENMSIAAGIPQPKVYIIDDSAPNAFAAGRDPKHAMVAVTTGLLDKLERTELEGVIAHEISHIRNYDVKLMSLVAILAGTVALLSDIFLRWTFWGGGRRRSKSDGGGQLQLIMFVVAIALALLAPLIAVIIKMEISRKREYLADASGAMLTRYPEGLARALEKISLDKEPLEAANKATAHMYIINPLKEFKGSPRGWFSGMFQTHPPVEERIAALRAM
ncbi:MAG: zinc metalloprotease HtpX [Candidatus Margulisbacteria bacterium]|nr:zinc metalloprotease HtpX [Candidatus Margulisiibacteriota bacterium]MBU1021704.1 zinc metalloprotease HtpX [Candidatus Margulisiibacteriota bacterium]MBU1729450.1 zinc metalloprotease HtpX [Candidatus Margulisiibacteriota bacterium]MBU1955449.1 zinc metalloprotease HtpX [Candidatus Margulisiibacteriota bacterium]